MTTVNAKPEVGTGNGFASADLECDLVMKGGITSGVVYPPAVLALAERYRFRSIGGTSAGAIAAALTAAAEYDRNGGGFRRLAAISERLGEGTFLLDLFQPSGRTRPLMRTLLDLTASKSRKSAGRRSFLAVVARVVPRLFKALILHDPRAFWVGAAAGAVVAVLLAWMTLALVAGWGNAPLGPWLVRGGWVVVLVVAAVGGLIGGVVHLAKVLVREVPQNLFGLCSGRRDGPATAGPGAGPDVLTDWLSASINECAGLPKDGPPLTFGDLKSKQVELKMMTSDLSHGRPYVLPLEQRIFLFNVDEMRRLFPDAVVKHLVDKSHKSTRSSPPQGFHFLPAAVDLPVAVAMRMSLSFPLLISAVPLWTVSAAAYARRQPGAPLALRPDDLQRNVFSDGGICSNFPIHFFDAWLPTRPTFGINLTSLPDEAVAPAGAASQAAAVRPEFCSSLKASADGDGNGNDAAPSATADSGADDEEVSSPTDVYLPRPNEYLTPEWAPIDDLPTFLAKILDTARGYHDNTQTLLPSYRERIVQVRFAQHEGGLNLAMDEATIHAIREKGRRAGQTLRDQFNFEHHQWVRFRVLMAQLEAQMIKMQAALEPGRTSVQQLLDAARLRGEPPFPYPREADWCRDASACVNDLLALIRQWHPRQVFDPDSPRPKPVLRVTPNL